MTINWERIALWRADLESGLHAQTTGYLRVDNTFCCLGRACEVAIANGLDVAVTRRDDLWAYDGRIGNLPDAVAAWYGLGTTSPSVLVDADQRELTVLNDTLWTFEEIAKLLDGEHLLHVVEEEIT